MSRQAKPRKLPADRITRWCRESQGNLVAIEANVAEIVKANDWMDDARAGIDYSAVRRGGSEGSATERAALANRPDNIASTATEFLELLEQARLFAYRARMKAEKLMADWSDEAKRDAASFTANRANAPGTSSDPCGNCGRVVAGTPNDRLRAGRCQACWRYKERHGEAERPTELWDNGQCPATRMVPGEGEYECALPMGHAQESETDHGWVCVGDKVTAAPPAA